MHESTERAKSSAPLLADGALSTGSQSNTSFCQGVASIYKSAVEDLISYLNEYGGAFDFLRDKISSLDANNPVLEAKRNALQTVVTFDVVVFAKEGCGFCARAKQLLCEREKDLQFTMQIIDGNNGPTKSALRYLVNVDDITFPQIVVNGYYIGGADNLTQWDASGEFARLLRTSKSSVHDPGHNDDIINTTRFTWFAPLVAQAAKPDIFFVPHMPRNTDGAWYPRNWPWYTFQWCLHSNLVRYISFLQICIMVPAAVLIHTSSSGSVAFGVAYFLLILLFVDLFLLVFNGASPLSPTGVISTYFLWKVRGNATAAVPYKVVWAVYISSILPVFMLKNYNGVYAALIASITNSVILVVFRF